MTSDLESFIHEKHKIKGWLVEITVSEGHLSLKRFSFVSTTKSKSGIIILLVLVLVKPKQQVHMF